MRSKLTTLLTVIGAVTVLVLAANTVAMATTGKAILAGKINTASKMTSIARTTPGTGLQVKTKSSANAPFAVNGTGKVANLNADKLDGYDSSQLATKPLYLIKNVTTPVYSIDLAVPVPVGTYLFSYSLLLRGTANLGDVTCYLIQSNGSTKYVGEVDQLNVDQIEIGVSGSGLVDRASGGVIALHCAADETFVTNGNQPIQIVMTKVNGSGGL